MTYSEALQFLFDQLPMFHRVGAAAYKPSLINTQALCEWLNHPEKEVKTIHVGGTNGKGSTSSLIASSLQCAGFKVGLYTSPHLIDFRERIKINGEWINEDFITDFVFRYKNWNERDFEPSFFELTFAMAMEYFYAQGVDYAIIEVGMGGRLDSTNVITPIHCVITNVSKDHMQFLGDTIPKIAQEKAGILKPNIPATFGPMRDEALVVLKNKAHELGIPFETAEIQTTFDSPLTGACQEENKSTAYTALESLKKQIPGLTTEHIRQGFADVIQNTGISGRFQTLSDHPKTIVDVGHNEDGLKFVFSEIAQIPHQNLHIVLGMVNDKDVENILTMFPPAAHYYFCKANIPRGMDANELCLKAQSKNLRGEVFDSVAAAYTASQIQAQPQDLILVTGSFFTVAEVLAIKH
jgi:dihydrofolate synthase/folylpolyglutamate synthase